MDSVIIHIKATYQGEVRRFQCQPTFQVLESTLRSLYVCKLTDQVLITFLDDENEYCRITCQMELEYAVTLPSPLRLVMKLVPTAPEPAQLAEHPTAIPNESVKARLDMINAALDNPSALPPRKLEQLQKRKQKLTAQLAGKPVPCHQGPHRQRGLEERLAMLTSAMELPNLPLHRLEALSRRRDAIVAKLHSLPSAATIPTSAPSAAAIAPNNTPTPFDQHTGTHPCADRLRARLAHIDVKLAQSDLPSHKLEKWTRKKFFIEAKLACSSSLNGRSQFWQMRLDNVTAALDNPELPAHRRYTLTQQKDRLNALLANPEAHQGHWHPCRGAAQTAHFQMRLQHINDALARPDLSETRRQKLTQKKAHFEAKLADTTTHAGPHGGPHGGPQYFGCHSLPGTPPHVEHGWGPCARAHHGGPHHGDHGHPGRAGGTHFEEKLAWINQALQDPNTPPHRLVHLAKRKEMIEARIAHKGAACQPTPEKVELVALRGAVGSAKVNLKNARQSGLKDAELSPFIDAVATAKAALCKRRLQIKTAAKPCKVVPPFDTHQ